MSFKTKGLGMILLSVWLILYGLFPLLSMRFAHQAQLMDVLAIAAASSCSWAVSDPIAPPEPNSSLPPPAPAGPRAGVRFSESAAGCGRTSARSIAGSSRASRVARTCAEDYPERRPEKMERHLSRRQSARWALAALLSVGSVAASGAPSFELPALVQPATQEHHPGKVVLVHLVTPDLAGSKRFYSGLFGGPTGTSTPATPTIRSPCSTGSPSAASFTGPCPRANTGSRRGSLSCPCATSRKPSARPFPMPASLLKAETSRREDGRRSSPIRRAPCSPCCSPRAAILPTFSPNRRLDLELPDHERPRRGRRFYQSLADYAVFDLNAADGREHLLLATDAMREPARARCRRIPAIRTRSISCGLPAPGTPPRRPRRSADGCSSNRIRTGRAGWSRSSPIHRARRSACSNGRTPKAKRTQNEDHVSALGNRRAHRGAARGSVGCVATVDDGRRGGYGVGYYEPYGQPYGGWPSGYHVAPPRGDRDRETQSRPPREKERSRKYRPAEASRPVSSLPSKRRSSDHDHGH